MVKRLLSSKPLIAFGSALAAAYIRFVYKTSEVRRDPADTDAKLFLKFDSSDIYAKMESGKWYRVRTVGWRWSLFSKYENILKAEALPGPPIGAKTS